MHIIVIAWLWVILMMSITERSVTGGIMTFIFYGLLPCALLLWLVAGHRRIRRAQSMREEQVKAGNGSDPGADQQDLQR